MQLLTFLLVLIILYKKFCSKTGILILMCLSVMQQELAAVFKKIGDKQTCTIGLYGSTASHSYIHRCETVTCFYKIRQ